MKQTWYRFPDLRRKDRFLVMTIGKDVFLLFQKGGSLRRSREWLLRMKEKFIRVE